MVWPFSEEENTTVSPLLAAAISSLKDPVPRSAVEVTVNVVGTKRSSKDSKRGRKVIERGLVRCCRWKKCVDQVNIFVFMALSRRFSPSSPSAPSARRPLRGDAVVCAICAETPTAAGSWIIFPAPSLPVNAARHFGQATVRPMTLLLTDKGWRQFGQVQRTLLLGMILTPIAEPSLLP